MSWLAFVLSIVMTVVEGAIAYREKAFNRKQLGPRIQACRHRGQAFIEHGGMWGDVLFLSFVIGIATTYCDQWSGKQVLILSAITLIINIAMHTWWAKAQVKIPGHIVRNGNITISGLINFAYLQMTLTLVLLFYFCSIKVELIHAWVVTTLLTVFMPCALIQPGWMHNNHHFNKFDIAKTLVLAGILWWAHFQLLPWR